MGWCYLLASFLFAEIIFLENVEYMSVLSGMVISLLGLVGFMDSNDG